MSGYQILSGTGAAAYSGSLSASQFYCAGIVTLVQAGAAPASSSGLLMSAFA